MTIWVTAYCCCRLCCGEDAHGITASGAIPREGLTCAAPRRIAFGTVLMIPGVGSRVVQDRLAHRYDNRVDVYVKRHEDAVRFGKRRLRVEVVK